MNNSASRTMSQLKQKWLLPVVRSFPRLVALCTCLSAVSAVSETSRGSIELYSIFPCLNLATHARKSFSFSFSNNLFITCCRNVFGTPAKLTLSVWLYATVWLVLRVSSGKMCSYIESESIPGVGVSVTYSYQIFCTIESLLFPC